MSKDTIYIDVEDDITAIIGKVKNAKSKIVALVPPKRVGVLQSAVNLRLLARAAKQSDKHLVLISGNSALTALAASARIPSARTLQSKPELAQVPVSADDDIEDIIDGVDLPVGDHVRTDDAGAEESPSSAPAVDSAIRASSAEDAAIAPPPARPKPTLRKNSISVPNFDTFRKKMVLGISGLVLLVGFLVWAIWFAPHAHVVISARTIETSANPAVAIAPNASTDAKAGTLKAVQQVITQDAALEFEATGEKEVGDKAKGEVIFRNCESENEVTIERGTGVSAGGKTYITQATVTVAGGRGNWISGCNPGSSDPVTVLAQDIGEDYDMESGTLCVAGHECSGEKSMQATISSAIDGGSKRKVKVVTKQDVKEATDQLSDKNASELKQQLTEKFGEGVVALDTTFAVNTDKVTSSPAVDSEAKDGTAKLTGSISYTMLGVASNEISQFLDDYFDAQIKDEENRRVYNNGSEKTTFINVKDTDNGATATMTATATLGPRIDDAAVKAQAKGKKYGEVQAAIEGISGVESVDVKFSPFWVRTVPDDEERITIEFKLDESE